MRKAHIELISQDEIELSVFDGEQPSVSTRLGAADIDSLIAVLSQVRTRMTPEVPRTIPEGTRPNGPVDPLWMVPGAAPLPGKLLAVRHPGLGWLMFQFPPAEALKLGGALVGVVGAQPSNPQSGTDRPN